MFAQSIVLDQERAALYIADTGHHCIRRVRLTQGASNADHRLETMTMSGICGQGVGGDGKTTNDNAFRTRQLPLAIFRWGVRAYKVVAVRRRSLARAARTPPYPAPTHPSGELGRSRWPRRADGGGYCIGFGQDLFHVVPLTPAPSSRLRTIADGAAGSSRYAEPYHMVLDNPGGRLMVLEKHNDIRFIDLAKPGCGPQLQALTSLTRH